MYGMNLGFWVIWLVWFMMSGDGVLVGVGVVDECLWDGFGVDGKLLGMFSFGKCWSFWCGGWVVGLILKGGVGGYLLVVFDGCVCWKLRNWWILFWGFCSFMLWRVVFWRYCRGGRLFVLRILDEVMMDGIVFDIGCNVWLGLMVFVVLGFLVFLVMRIVFLNLMLILGFSCLKFLIVFCCFFYLE